MNFNATFIGQMATFIFFAWFCMKFIWPPLRTAMRERQEAIAAGLSAAEEADKKLAEAASGAEAELAKAKEEAAAIIDQARQRANQMIEEAKGEARQEGERMIESAKAEIDQEMNRAERGFAKPGFRSRHQRGRAGSRVQCRCVQTQRNAR